MSHEVFIEPWIDFRREVLFIQENQETLTELHEKIGKYLGTPEQLFERRGLFSARGLEASIIIPRLGALNSRASGIA